MTFSGSGDLPYWRQYKRAIISFVNQRCEGEFHAQPVEDKDQTEVIQRISRLKAALPELTELERLIDEGSQHMRIRVPAHIQHGEDHLPFYVIEMGSTRKDAPVLALVGGVHGVERIGTQVILSFLKTLIRRLRWDPAAIEQLHRIRLVIIPIVNPGGMADNSRTNPNGVDLMRNAPVEALQRTPFLVGGQRISPKLPWYRGERDKPMEPENQALTDAIHHALKDQPFCMSLDCHSGFGTKDRLWFPYAKSVDPWPGIDSAHAMTELFEYTYPHHDLYLFEPQAHSYTTSGDVWDYLYDDYRTSQPNGCYLPMTLEMGSWLWVKKNPRHLFRYHSLFNPILPHRQQRILRRHLTFFDFLMSATATMASWAPTDALTQQHHHMAALTRWYPGR
ncbi:zinc carboxypeptidase [Thalassolituus oleivorans R6-15]|nr:zinc carboxypeptidase [Thalassolituus oleivorans R6-15]